jgi:uncharacterized protein
MSKKNSTDPAQPWWKFGHVWLGISGPLIVVIAGFTPLSLAVRMPDPVISEDYYRKGVEINKTLGATPGSLAPAVQARNHAATGASPPAQKP